MQEADGQDLRTLLLCLLPELLKSKGCFDTITSYIETEDELIKLVRDQGFVVERSDKDRHFYQARIFAGGSGPFVEALHRVMGPANPVFEDNTLFGDTRTPRAYVTTKSSRPTFLRDDILVFQVTRHDLPGDIKEDKRVAKWAIRIEGFTTLNWNISVGQLPANTPNAHHIALYYTRADARTAAESRARLLMQEVKTMYDKGVAATSVVEWISSRVVNGCYLSNMNP